MQQSFTQKIMAHENNADFTEHGWRPLFAASETARLVIIGQAPGIRAQTSGIPWDDKSGQRLIEWLGVSDDQFRNPEIISLLPMDFYYPGKGSSGDSPPRRDFAGLWHPQILELMPEVKLTILIGNYAQKHYLVKRSKRNLTENVLHYQDYLPEYFPIVHPSPLNFRWQMKNPWFEKEVIPNLRKLVAEIIS